MEWFLKALKKDYANFNGRARREEYWMFVLFSMLIYVVMFGVLLGSMVADIKTLGIIMVVLCCIYILGIFVPTLAVTVRRLHDTNRSGWAYLISFIPLVGPIILLVFLCSEGTLGANRYGPDPKAEQPTDKNIGIIQ
ncbi:DUF805 domain-containing protein [Hafnia paralvei]|uniref:DUF805 domain-containing protein n=1 Tax=Hafnia paralvei TaxID=546367 RepID=A0A4Q9EV28_9GAMM|nr:DUF805 domain-containing protein [Hafnia paralvei]AJR02047.1 hypothetical protein F652_4058 [Enterobacteriaceae bacterium bta3-1]TBM31510.1 DUF805 domain-containing protein [Hafnia paralvei]